MIKQTICNTLLLLCSIHLSFAQNLQITQLTVEDGLPSNNVYGSIQDAKGFIWFFTDKGISKYSGSEFKTFTVQDGLQTNDVWDLSEDKQGRIWIFAGGDKMQYILDDNVHDMPLAQPIKKTSYYSSNFTEDRVEFNFTQGVKHILENDTIHFLKKLQKKNDWQVLSDYPTKISLKNDAIRFSGLENNFLISKKGNKNHVFFERSNGNLSSFNFLFVTQKDDSFLKHFVILVNNKDKTVFVPDYKNIFHEMPSHAFATNQGEFIEIQTNLGTLVYDEKFKLVDKFIFKEQGLEYNVNKTLIDNNSNIWICTQDKGVIFVRAKNENLKTIDCLNDQNVLKIFGDGDDIYFCDGAGNIFNYSNEKCNKISNINSLKLSRQQEFVRDNQIINIKPYQENYIICTKFDVFLFNTDNNTIDYLFEQNPADTIFAIFSIKDIAYSDYKKSFVCTKSKGVYIVPEDLRTNSSVKILALPAVTLEYASKEKYFIGAIDGLYLLDLNTQELEKIYEDELNMRINNLVYRDSILYIGTDGYGLAYIADKKVYFENSTERYITSDLKIIDNSLWVTSNNGIDIFEITDNKSLIPIKKLRKSAGLISNEMQTLYRNKDFVFAGTKSGANKISLTSSFSDTETPLFYHASTYVNDIPISDDNKFSFKSNENNIQLRFDGISYKELNSVTYEYSLSGESSKTISSTDNKISYFNLAPGDYTFKAHAIDVEGIRSKENYALDFTISQPWHRKTSSLLLGLLLLSLLGYYLYKRRIETIKDEAETETKINKKFADLELQALRSQMNPHFVFNCMNTIQYLIDSNQSEEASKYLNEFATLMRLFLESSKESTITINEEIKLLKNYLSLEQMRLDGKFNFKINIDPKLQNSIVNIPSMMVQPFVENAIVHGLFHKKGQKSLSINFVSTDSDQIKCIIEDNGIGRKKSEEIQIKSKGKHKSRGIQIIKDRMELLKTRKEDFKIQFEDLFDDHGASEGTRVILHFDTI